MGFPLTLKLQELLNKKWASISSSSGSWHKQYNLS